MKTPAKQRRRKPAEPSAFDRAGMLAYAAELSIRFWRDEDFYSVVWLIERDSASFPHQPVSYVCAIGSHEDSQYGEWLENYDRIRCVRIACFVRGEAIALPIRSSVEATKTGHPILGWRDSPTGREANIRGSGWCPYWPGHGPDGAPLQVIDPVAVGWRRCPPRVPAIFLDGQWHAY